MVSIKTLSIPDDMEKFLQDNSDLSPSKMLQAKINEIQTNRALIFREVNRLQKQVRLLQEKLWEANEKITKFENVSEKKH